MDSVQLHLDIQNSLIKTLEQTQALMQRFNDNLQNAGKLTKVVEDHYDDIEKSQKKIVSLSQAWSKSLSGMGNILKGLVAPLATLFSSAKIIDTTRAVLKHNTAMRQLSFRMGEAGKTTGQLTSAMHEIASATGITTDEAATLVQQLRRLRVSTKDIAQLGKTTTMFSEITGVASESASTLAGQLIRMGKVGVKGATDIMTTMARVQAAIGLSEKNMEELVETTIYATKMLHQMGKTQGDIIRFNKGVAQLAGSFASVGIEASTVNGIIQDLLDPGKIEDNALLYAKLGVSMQEAISGDVDPALLAGRFKDLGQELKDMSGPAAAAMAQSLGMPLGQLRAMADAELDVAKGGKEMESMFKERLSPEQRLEKSMNRVSTLMQELATGPVLTIAKKLSSAAEFLVEKLSSLFGGGNKKGLIIAGIIGLIGISILVIRRLRRRLFAMGTSVAKHFGVATEESLVMAHKRAGIIAGKAVGGAGRAIARRERITGGPGFAAQMGRADDMALVAERQMLPAIKKMVEGTAEWQRRIAMGTRGISRISIISEQNNKRIKEKINLTQQEGVMVVENIKNREQDAKVQQREVQDRIVQLEKIKFYGKISSEQQWELSKLRKEDLSAQNQLLSMAKERGKEQTYYNNLQKNLVRNLSPEERGNMQKSLQDQLKRVVAEKEVANLRREDLGRQREVLRLNLRAAEEKKKMEATEMTGDEYVKLLKTIKEIEILQTETTADLTKQTQIIEQQNRLGQEARAGLASMKGMGIGDPNALKQSFWRRVLRMGQSAGNRVASGFKNAGRILRNSAKGFGTMLKERLNPKNWGKMLATRLRQAGGGSAMKGMARGLGRVAKIIGMLIGILMGTKVVRELIANTMKKITPLVQNLAKSLGPFVKTLIDSLVPFIKDLLDGLMPILKSILAAVIPILMNILPVIMDLVKKLMPVILSLVEGLMPILTILVDLLMPPLLKILGATVFLLGILVKALGTLMRVMIEMPARLGAFISAPFNKANRKIALEENLANARKGDLFSALHDFTKTIQGTGDTLMGVGMELFKSKYQPTPEGYEFEGSPESGRGVDVTGGVSPLAGIGGAGEAGPSPMLLTASGGKVSVTGPMQTQKTPAIATSENTSDIAGSSATTADSTSASLLELKRIRELAEQNNAKLDSLSRGDAIKRARAEGAAKINFVETAAGPNE